MKMFTNEIRSIMQKQFDYWVIKKLAAFGGNENHWFLFRHKSCLSVGAPGVCCQTLFLSKIDVWCNAVYLNMAWPLAHNV